MTSGDGRAAGERVREGTAAAGRSADELAAGERERVRRAAAGRAADEGAFEGLVVAFEASARPASVAARLSGRTLERVLDTARAHGSDLLPALDALVLELGATPRDVRAIVLGTGPGSYTGLRVAAATALGLARATDATALGVPSCDALAWAELEPGAAAWQLLDARGGALYLARLVRTADGVEHALAPVAVRVADAARRIGEGSEPIFAEPSAVEGAKLSPEQSARVRVDVHPRAGALLDLGLRRLAAGQSTPLEALEPLYLRAFGPLP